MKGNAISTENKQTTNSVCYSVAKYPSPLQCIPSDTLSPSAAVNVCPLYSYLAWFSSSVDMMETVIL